MYDVDGLMARLLAIKDLGRSAYYAYRVSQHVTEAGRPGSGTTAQIEKMARTTAKMQEDAFEAFMKKDVDLAGAVIDRMDLVRGSYNEISSTFLTSLGAAEFLPYSLIVRDIRGIAGYAVALADDAVLAASD